MSYDLGLTRRQILSALGYAGASLYLPSFAPRAHGDPIIPKRFLFFFTFHSNPYQNWIMRRPGLPTTGEWELDLRALAANEFSNVYAPLWDLRSKLLIFDSLSNMANLAQAEPLGHNGGPATILTASNHDRTGQPPSPGGGSYVISTAPSLDQIIADRIAVPGRLRSLELGTRQIGPYGAIWQPAGKPLPIMNDPTKVFTRLFPNGTTPTQPTTMTGPTREQKLAALSNSTVGFTRERYNRLAARLGGPDRRKLEVHRDLLRDLETQLGTRATGPGAVAGSGCPSKPPQVSGSSTPVKQRIDDFGRLVATAFACDLTRVASIQIDAMKAPDFGATLADVHEEAAHHFAIPEKVRWMGVYYRTHAEHFAGLLRQLDAIPEADGKTLLDHTIVLWAPECGSFVHETSHLPLVMAGGGGFRMGRYLYWPSDTPTGGSGDNSRYKVMGPPHSRLLVSIARQFGLDVNQIGNVTSGRGQSCLGPLERLL